MVSSVRDRRGDDRSGERRGGLEPGPARIGGMAQLRGVAPVPGSRWHGPDLPEFAGGPHAEHKKPLTAESRGWGNKE